MLRDPACLPPQYVPSIYVLLSTIIIVALRQWPALAFLYLGTYSSWVYLRFFQQQPESTMCGDPSEEFKFSSFFPEVLSPPLDAVGSVLLRVTRLKAGSTGGDGEAKPLLPTVATALGSNSADANRRRCEGLLWCDVGLMRDECVQHARVATGDFVSAQLHTHTISRLLTHMCCLFARACVCLWCLTHSSLPHSRCDVFNMARASHRERGARALEERLEMKAVAQAPMVESAAIAAAAAAASTLPDVAGAQA